MKQILVGISLGVLFSFIFSKVYASGNFEAKSWRDVDVGKYNNIIEEAKSNNQAWVSKPEMYVHYLLGMGETKQVLYSIDANSMESPTEYIFKLKRQGMLDDSVRGDINVVVLKKTDKGYWSVVSMKRASSCWRDKSKSFYGKPC